MCMMNRFLARFSILFSRRANAKYKSKKEYLIGMTYYHHLALAGVLLTFLMFGCGLKYMFPKTLEPQLLSDLKESESIVWGGLDDSGVYFLEEANHSQLDQSIAQEAESRRVPVWRIVDVFWMLAGKLDMGAADRQVELTFSNVETGTQIRTQNAAGISSDFPFYVVLPRGRYNLAIKLLWPRSQYQAQTERLITSTGGRNAIYIGHLHMGIKDRSSYRLFDLGNFANASKSFHLKHPNFRGPMIEQRVTEEVILVDKEGRKP
jgi:hypothetical protein